VANGVLNLNVVSRREYPLGNLISEDLEDNFKVKDDSILR
jgi:hypothetical protein